MNPKSHPIAKTSVDIRRSINRLKVLKEQFPSDVSVTSGLADTLIEALRQARSLIPKDQRDPDLMENQAHDD